MTSTDREGILDKYFYSYNNSGLISGIGRERRDLAAVSGQYDYQYDEIGRLTRSSLNGELKASYEYDAFGNRTSLIESDTQTTYRYDSLDRLVEARELNIDQVSKDVLSLNQSQAIVKTYDYDKRGNQTNEYVDGLLNKTFTFDATNMLSKVVDSEKGELENQYNGLGFRVATTRPEEKIEYLCDLSRDCFNLLERTVNGETESFIYDKNVISMSKAGNSYYYLQDELGSPMYMTGTDGAAVSSYAFDDFGRSIDPFTGKIKEAGNKQHTKHAYTTEGNIIQPFAFTGYQEDEFSGLKFAQARFYNAENGRFVTADKIKGFAEYPLTINAYLYCIDNPTNYVDEDGNFLHALIGAGIGAAISTGMEIYNQVKTGEFDGTDLLCAAAKGAAEGAITAVCGPVVAGAAVATVEFLGDTAQQALNGEEITWVENIGKGLIAGVTAYGFSKGAEMLTKALYGNSSFIFSGEMRSMIEKTIGEIITDGGLLKDLFNYAISGAADAGEAWGLLASYVGQETVQSYVSAEVTSGATSLYEEGIKYVEQCIL